MSKVPTDPGHPAATDATPPIVAEGTTPPLMAEGTTTQIGLQDLLSIISMIIEKGHIDTLGSLANEAKANVVVPAATANLVKTFVAAHQELSDHPLGHRIMGQPGRDPADGGCGFPPA